MQRWSFSLRRIFVAGLLVTLPGVVAAYVLWLAFSYFDGLLRPLLHRYVHVQVPGLGLLALVTLVLLVGLFTSNLFGARIVRAVSLSLEKIPVFSPLYRGMREISQVFLGEQAKAFRRVALVEWPRSGTYTLVFVMAEPAGTGTGLPDSLVTVFWPSTPNPTTGFVLLVKPETVIPVDMSVEQAIKLMVSAGAVQAARLDAAPSWQGPSAPGAAEPLLPAR